MAGIFSLADNEHWRNRHDARWIERPADKSAGYAYKARLRGLALMIILL
ncbi:MAG TPA: hypothetical protein VEX13_10650 [Chloroflexia bacterium]|nr:hypothetical protein [Chloroflexia bacterium]